MSSNSFKGLFQSGAGRPFYTLDCISWSIRKIPPFGVLDVSDA